MFFEGSEKKLEITLSEGVGIDFRKWSRSQVDELVESSNAQVLSSISNDQCDAYLLSESSLFLWKDRLVMITCGQTTLIHAATKVFSWVGKENVECCIYERKNEYFPQMQVTDFKSDYEELNKVVDGQALRFGNADEHHLFLYHMNKEFTPVKGDKALEVLMYDLQGPAQEAFCKEGQTREGIYELTGLERIFGDFKVDDYVFSPYGYSLNAIRDEEYYTIHVTPQDSGPYVSFETNVKDCYQSVLDKVLAVFNPRSFDLIQFAGKGELEEVKASEFLQRSHVQDLLKCGYVVDYSHFSKPNTSTQKPYNLNGE